jgi:hypothetical protein
LLEESQKKGRLAAPELDNKSGHARLRLRKNYSRAETKKDLKRQDW